MKYTFVSLSILAYLFLLGSHVVATRWFPQSGLSFSSSLLIEKLTNPQIFLVVYFLPVLAYTLLQVQWLRRKLQYA
jgi:hypothetical protein